jgi:Tfp pilus assembly protein PilW
MADRRRNSHGARLAIRGFTLTETLVALVVMFLVLAGAWTLLAASGRVYDDIVWQNRVNAEARQAIEDICDSVRLSGQDQDLISRPATSALPQVLVPVAPDTTAMLLNCFTLPAGTLVTYTVQQSPTSGDYILTRQFQRSSLDEAARYIVNVHFDYEYRTPTSAATSATDTRWQMTRLSDLGSWSGTNQSLNPANLITVVYVTITAQVTPYSGGPTYQRTLHSAVHLRGPYNTTVPPALTGP